MSKSSKTKDATKAATKKAPIKRKANAYQMPESIPIGEVLTDLSKQQWKIGPSIGSGGFGEIYCATKVNGTSKKYEDYPFVVKVVSIAVMKYMKKKLLSQFKYLIIGASWKWTTFC